MKLVGAIFGKMNILNIFLMWTTLNFKDRSQTKKRARDICRGALDIVIGWDWSVGLWAPLGDGHTEK